jgi:hypothetical protein
VAAYQQARSSRENDAYQTYLTQDFSAETAGSSDGRSVSAGPTPNDAHERLSAGEIVSWHQIVRDTPMLETIPVTQFVNAGVVWLMLDCDPFAGTIDFSTLQAEAVIVPEPPNSHSWTNNHDHRRGPRAMKE